MKNEKLTDEEIIKDVIARYGHVLDLGKTPYLIVEILYEPSGGESPTSPTEVYRSLASAPRRPRARRGVSTR